MEQLLTTLFTNWQPIVALVVAFGFGGWSVVVRNAIKTWNREQGQTNTKIDKLIELEEQNHSLLMYLSNRTTWVESYLSSESDGKFKPYTNGSKT